MMQINIENVTTASKIASKIILASASMEIALKLKRIMQNMWKNKIPDITEYA